MSNWVQVAGKLGSESVIYAMCEFEGILYAGTGQGGRLYRLNSSGDAWEQVCAQYSSQTRILSLLVYNNKLYAGTYRNSLNNGGKLLSLNSSKNGWDLVSNSINDQRQVSALCEYNSRLYGGTGSLGNLQRLNLAGNSWELVCSQLDFQATITALCVYEGVLYAGTYNGADGGYLFRLNSTEDAWELVAESYLDDYSISSLIVYQDRLYGTSYNSGRLLRLNSGKNAWELVCSQTDSQIEIASLVEYGGSLYGGTGNNAFLFKLNSSQTGWIKICTQLNSETLISKVISYSGSIYGSTTTNGTLLRAEGLPKPGYSVSVVLTPTTVGEWDTVDTSPFGSATCSGYTGFILGNTTEIDAVVSSNLLSDRLVSIDNYDQEFKIGEPAMNGTYSISGLGGIADTSEMTLTLQDLDSDIRMDRLIGRIATIRLNVNSGLTDVNGGVIFSGQISELNKSRDNLVLILRSSFNSLSDASTEGRICYGSYPIYDATAAMPSEIDDLGRLVVDFLGIGEVTGAAIYDESSDAFTPVYSSSLSSSNGIVTAEEVIPELETVGITYSDSRLLYLYNPYKIRVQSSTVFDVGEWYVFIDGYPDGLIYEGPEGDYVYYRPNNQDNYVRYEGPDGSGNHVFILQCAENFRYIPASGRMYLVAYPTSDEDIQILEELIITADYVSLPYRAFDFLVPNDDFVNSSDHTSSIKVPTTIIKIDDEYLEITQEVSVEFNDTHSSYLVRRGINNSVAAEHPDGSAVYRIDTTNSDTTTVKPSNKFTGSLSLLPINVANGHYSMFNELRNTGGPYMATNNWPVATVSPVFTGSSVTEITVNFSSRPAYSDSYEASDVYRRYFCYLLDVVFPTVNLDAKVTGMKLKWTGYASTRGVAINFTSGGKCFLLPIVRAGGEDPYFFQKMDWEGIPTGKFIAGVKFGEAGDGYCLGNNLKDLNTTRWVLTYQGEWNG